MRAPRSGRGWRQPWAQRIDAASLDDESSRSRPKVPRDANLASLIPRPSDSPLARRAG